MSVPEIIDRLTDDVLASLAQNGVPFRPGARELLMGLREAGIPTALVTMSMRRMATSIVDLLDFDAFDLVVAGDDVERPKPFPDPYLRAAELLGVDIRDTVAIEDSPNGVRSAVAAGCTVIGVPNLVSLAGTGTSVIIETLAGVGVADVARMHAERGLHAGHVA
jgi:HAD superfamily hydrolase (TIGR01509 family)